MVFEFLFSNNQVIYQFKDDTTMDEEIQRINDFYNKALKAKDIARRGDNEQDQFKVASEFFQQAVSHIDKVLETLVPSKINFNTQTSALREYYLYESNECLYAFEYKHGNFDKAIAFANSAKANIELAIKIIDDNFNLLNQDTKTFLTEQKNNWTLCLLSIPIKLIEPVGKNAMKSKDYITALDSYRQMGTLQDKVDQYVCNSNLAAVYKRIEKGNYFASKASIAMSLASVYIEKSKKNDYKKEILEQFLDALHFIKLAQDINPEQDKYKEGADSTIHNIQKVLLNSKDKWFQFLTEFKNNKNLEAIMQQTDNNYYKRQSAKLELEKDKPKQFILTFGFLFSAFIGLGYFLLQIASSELSWYKFIALMLCLPLFFIIIGAFALRTTDSLKEENFMKLMELALKTNLRGLKGLVESNKEQN